VRGVAAAVGCSKELQQKYSSEHRSSLGLALALANVIDEEGAATLQATTALAALSNALLRAVIYSKHASMELTATTVLLEHLQCGSSCELYATVCAVDHSTQQCIRECGKRCCGLQCSSALLVNHIGQC
jgi:hypothetical protein